MNEKVPFYGGPFDGQFGSWTGAAIVVHRTEQVDAEGVYEWDKDTSRYIWRQAPTDE